jgi:hypothetical protein
MLTGMAAVRMHGALSGVEIVHLEALQMSFLQPMSEV